MKKYLLIGTAIFLFACLAAPIPTSPVETPTVLVPTTVIPAVESTSAPTQTADSSLRIGSCPLFPADNFWNARVDALPLDPHSASWIDSIGRTESFHMDFGSGGMMGELSGFRIMS